MVKIGENGKYGPTGAWGAFFVFLGKDFLCAKSSSVAGVIDTIRHVILVVFPKNQIKNKTRVNVLPSKSNIIPSG